MSGIKYVQNRKRKRTNSRVIRVNEEFIDLINEMKKEAALILKVDPEKIPTTLITEKIVKMIKKEKKEFEKEINKIYNEI